jgi:putative Mg2+ transporter-C (MgtC) family protein
MRFYCRRRCSIIPSAQEIDLVVKLLVASVMGGLVGLEREHDRRPAGLRTNILICLGATLFGVIGTFTFATEPNGLSRVWQNIITGVGFLGAGVVIKDEHGVTGLTTAAGVWAVAAVGLAIAAGMYFVAIVAEIIILVTLYILGRMERGVEHRARPEADDD